MNYIDLLDEYFSSAVRGQTLILKTSEEFKPEFATEDVMRIHTFAVFLSFAQFMKLTKKYPLAIQKVRLAVVTSCVDENGLLKRSTGGLIEFMDGVDLLRNFIPPEDIFTRACEYFLGVDPTELSLWELKNLFEYAKTNLSEARKDRETSYNGYTERFVLNYLKAENMFFPDVRDSEEVASFITQSLMTPTNRNKH